MGGNEGVVSSKKWQCSHPRACSYSSEKANVAKLCTVEGASFVAVAMAAGQVWASALRHLHNAAVQNVQRVSSSSSCSSSLHLFPFACRFYYRSAASLCTEDGVWRPTLYPFIASSSSVCGDLSLMKWSGGSLAHYDGRSVGSGMPSLCGRGDKRTRKGKRFKGTFGNCRPKRGSEARKLRKKWDIPHDPLAPDFTQPFPPRLS